jgi:hypothetical protein
MDMFLYTSMFSIQIHVYYLIINNELFVNNLLIYIIYSIIMNWLMKLNNKQFIWIH